MISLSYNAAYQYNRNEINQLKGLRKKYGHHYQHGYGSKKLKVWYDGEVKTKAIKHAIIKKLLYATRFRCVYCMKLLARSEKPIDHFINNAAYPKYSFHPLNLVPSCGYCNSTLKGAYNVFAIQGRKYHEHSFNIVHPILDDVDNHIVYQDASRTMIDYNSCSVEGKESIRLFALQTFEMFIERLSQNTRDTLYPLDDAEVLRLIAETATYKPR